MQADSINGPKPTVLEVTKLAVKKPDIKSESKSDNEAHHSLREKVIGIFSRRKNNPVDTFQQLASQEIPDDQSLLSQDPKKEPIISEVIQITKDSDEAQRLSQEIKSEATKDSENQSTNETLFPFRPSLYEQHHQKYEKERKTIKGAIVRSINIRRLQKEGFSRSDAKEVYDSLRSRGISLQQIEKPKRNSFKDDFYGNEPKTDEELISLLKKAPKIIDRQNYIGIGEEPASFNVKHLSDGILTLSDEQFQKRYQQIQPFVFFNLSDVLEIMQQSSFNPQVDIFIEHFSKIILNEQNQQDKSLDLFRPYLREMLVSGSISQRDILRYYKTFVFSDINPSKPITIPKELIDQAFNNRSGHEEKVVKYLFNIQDRQQQKFLLNIFEKSGGYFTTDQNYLFQSEFPTVDFYREFLSSKYYHGGSIVIQESVLDLIDDYKRQIYYQNVSNIPNPEIQIICLNADTKYSIPEYFDETNKPTGYLLFNYLKNVDHLENGKLPEIELDYLSRLPVKDQNKLNFTKFVREFLLNAKLNQGNYDTISNYFLINFNSISDYVNDEGQPNSIFYKTLLSKFNLDDKPAKYILDTITPDIINTFEPTEKIFWKGLLSLKNIDKDLLAIICYPDNDQISYFDQDGLPTNYLFTDLGQRGYISQEFLQSNLTHQVIDTFNPKDQEIWKGILSLKNFGTDEVGAIIRHISDQKDSFNDDHLPTSYLFYSLFLEGVLEKSFLTANLTPEVLDSFSYEQQKLWKFISSQDEIIHDQTILSFLFNHQNEVESFIDNNQLTEKFYQQYVIYNPKSFIESFDKEIWEKTFGKDLISDLLISLPKTKTADEKRNAFTHNQYDRTSKFFIELVSNEKLHFQLNPENIIIATEYIKNYGLAKNSEFFNYFQSLYKHQSDPSITLPSELIENQIDSLEKLNQEIKKIQKICFSQEPLVNLSDLTPFQQNLISIITGHSTNRFIRTPMDIIISDFSFDIQSGEISPLPKEFHPEVIGSSMIETKTDKKIGDSQILATIKQEILSAINQTEDISTEKDTLLLLFEQKITSLEKRINKETNPKQSKKQEYFQIQLESIKKQIDLLSGTDSIDDLLTNIVAFNLDLGTNQEKFNSILRQLVFKKVFVKHQDSNNMIENLKITLENDDTVPAVNNILNFINNTIKDHALNFQTNNQDNYWKETTFETMKKYSPVFKKNLSLSTYIRELESYKQSFVTTNMGIDENISVIPDRGLIGEMSGYMADVCYTKVYPLLKQFPDMVPYKFISNPDSESPSFIGSTLVFKVEGSDNQPVFLIRAFDIPQEQSYDIGKFFESFVDHLASVAQNVGVKKIIIAGAEHTISNYANTIHYVTSKYIKDKEPFTLKNNFNFNNYDTTGQCYLVRDIPSAEMPGNEPGSESRL